MEQAAVIMGVLSGLSGILLGWLGLGRRRRRDAEGAARLYSTLELDMEYIKRGVDDIRGEQRAMRQEFGALAERVARVEESVRQAHERLNAYNIRNP